MSEAKIKNLLKNQYFAKVNNLLGFDVDELTLVGSKVVIKNCSDCKNEFRISDFGLEEDNVALFWRECQGLPTSNYCAGYDKSKISEGLSYRFCYEGPCIEPIKKAIIKTDMIRAIARSRNKTYEFCLKRLSHNRKVNDTKINETFQQLCKNFTSERSRMWNEIDEGLRRILVMPTEEFKNGNKIEGEMTNQKGFSIRSLHGHQFRELLRNDKYNATVDKPDIICVGHFHLLMIFKKFDTWVVMTGHFLKSNIPREKGFFCHLGASEMTLDKPENEPYFKLFRGRDI